MPYQGLLPTMAGVSGPLLSTLHRSHSVCKTVMKHVTWTVMRKLSSRQLPFLSSSTASCLSSSNHPFRKPRLPGHVYLLEINSSCLQSQKRHKHEVEYPPLIESEIEEKFIRGSGPGGQKINKTSNCVMLKHLPTGIVVKCQESRSLETNRARARRHLQERLDWYYNGEQSVLAQEKQEQIRKKIRSKNVTNRKLEKLRQFKEREGLD